MSSQSLKNKIQALYYGLQGPSWPALPNSLMSFPASLTLTYSHPVLLCASCTNQAFLPQGLSKYPFCSLEHSSPNLPMNYSFCYFQLNFSSEGFTQAPHDPHRPSKVALPSPSHTLSFLHGPYHYLKLPCLFIVCH